MEEERQPPLFLFTHLHFLQIFKKILGEAVLDLDVTCSFINGMKKWSLILALMVLSVTGSVPAMAQCSVCTRTAQQLGEKPAKGLNAGILYLAFTPLALIGFLGYRWWKKNNMA
jgi:hypothetical protein